MSVLLNTHESSLTAVDDQQFTEGFGTCPHFWCMGYRFEEPRKPPNDRLGKDSGVFRSELVIEITPVPQSCSGT